MKKYLFLCCFFLSQVIAFNQSGPEHFTFPAEFEEHEAIWMAWKKFPAAAAFKEESVFNLCASQIID